MKCDICLTLIKTIGLCGCLRIGISRFFVLQVSQCSLRDLLLHCCVDDAPDVRQSAFALLGDLARVSLAHIAST